VRRMTNRSCRMNVGPFAGDAILREIGGMLIKNVRGQDIPCRYGGEEFVIIVPEAKLTDGYTRAQDLSTRIRPYI
jgi:diguanylate cyclase (GGDEF)-like protein